MDKSSIKRLLASMKCGGCGRRYEADSIDILGQQEDLWFLKILCPVCHTQYLVVAVVKAGMVNEVITDLTEVELEKFSGIGGVVTDDVLDMHNFLTIFDGDLSQLLRRK
ncbi:hypothetical protein ACFLX7_03200 [Chloroflexota bacterium]